MTNLSLRQAAFDKLRHHSKFNMKILVIRFSSIGDIVLTTPVIRCLKNQISDVEIHALTKKKFSGMYKTNPYINKVYEYDDSLKKNIEELKLENYDYIVDLQKNKRSLRVTRALHKPHSSFPKLNFKKFFEFRLNAFHIVVSSVKLCGV